MMRVEDERRIYMAFAQLRGGPSMASRAVHFWRQVADPSADPSDIDYWRKLVGGSHDSPEAMARGARMVGASTIRSIRHWLDKLDKLGISSGKDEALADARALVGELKQERDRYRAEAIACHRRVIESWYYEQFVVDGHTWWSKDIRESEAYALPSLNFLESEKLVEWHPGRTNVFRLLDEPRGGGE